MYLFYFLAVEGLCCCSRAFPSCSDPGLLSSCGVWASYGSGFFYCRARAPGCMGLSRCSMRVWYLRLVGSRVLAL